MRLLHLKEHRSITSIAREYGTHDSAISRIVRWATWAHTDHDLKDLPRPKLVGGTRPLPPEEKHRRILERKRRYRDRRRRMNCKYCSHFRAWACDCGIGYPEARETSGAFAADCPIYSPESSPASSSS
jgi:hypothetical protein